MLSKPLSRAWRVPLGAALAIASAAHAKDSEAPAAPSQDIAAYENAMVWTGSGFEPRSFLVIDGTIRIVSEAEIDAIAAVSPGQTVDLSGKYVVPALTDAHNHVTMPADWASNGFLGRGTYYVWNPTTIQLGNGAKDYFARPDTYDVKYSLGGITEPKGHPERLYVEGLSERVYGGRKDFLGDAFHYGSNREEIEAALDLLVEQGADFVKAYLLYSEEYAERRDDDERYGAKGINPANAALIVEEALERGFLTTFHVETASDLVTAAESGAFAAMHLPGYGGFRDGNVAVQMTLREDQAKIVAESGMLLIPTYLIAANSFSRADTDLGRTRGALSRAIQRHNLSLLRDAGASFVIGTDGFGGVAAEIEHLAGLDVFEPAELLEIAFQSGAKLFPDRAIGCLQDGCEADFLALSGNPLDDLAQLKEIEMRVKAGAILEL